MNCKMRQVIKDCLDVIPAEDMQLPDGTTQKTKEIMPICFAHFILHIAAIMVRESQIFMEKMEVPTWDDDEFNDIDRIIAILIGEDFIRGSVLFIRLQDFLTWYLEQEEKDYSSISNMWYDSSVLLEDYNKFLKEFAERLK